MNIELLERHIISYVEKLKEADSKKTEEMNERKNRISYYQALTYNKIKSLSEEGLFEFVSKLWAMLIWGNKQYYVDKLIQDNGFDNFKVHLADFIWKDESIDVRWDRFRKNIKGFGPAMMSEVLAHVYPEKYIVWNRRAYVALNYLGINDLPSHNYQLTGKTYERLSQVGLEMLEIMKKHIPDSNLLTLDYFIWDELQVKKNLNKIFNDDKHVEEDVEKADIETSDFIHNEIRDKLADIGEWLGFKARTEIKIAEGSKVDTVWESTIGNLGRIIYVFEVQTKGSLDSLVMNLMKSLTNPAVQGIVAVTDSKQIEKLKKHVATLGEFNKKLRYWNYEEVLLVYDNLEVVNEQINKLSLVPDGFIPLNK